MGFTLRDITDLMREYNDAVETKRGECDAWRDYVEDCWATLACGPDGHGAPSDDGTATKWQDDGVLLPFTFADYWFDVAQGRSDDYSPETGERVS